MSNPIVIVGAGLAGLVCARRLNRAGREVLILESSDRPGGRLKTDEVEGFLVDRGFQVYFTAYPHARTEVNLGPLKAGAFIPGARVWDGKSFHEVRDDDPLAMALSPFLPIGDKLLIAALTAELKRKEWDGVWSDPDVSAEELLRRRGFSNKFLDRFARPFFGGVFLDRSLGISGGMFSFVWKALSAGQTVIPAQGIEAIPKQIAADLPASCFRFRTKVDGLVRKDGRVRGVRLSNGETVEAEAVVISVDARTAAKLTDIRVPTGSVGCTTVAFDAPEPIASEPVLTLNGGGGGTVNHVADITSVCPQCSPSGRRLIAATVLGVCDGEDISIARSVALELAQWFPKLHPESWRPLKVNRVAFSQMAQAPGFRSGLPGSVGEPGVYLAGEFTTCSSIDGAIESGQNCSRAILAEAGQAVA